METKVFVKNLIIVLKFRDFINILKHFLTSGENRKLRKNDIKKKKRFKTGFVNEKFNHCEENLLTKLTSIYHWLNM